MNAMTDHSQMRYALIKAKGGLGNRILSGVTGLVWADLAGRAPIIDWRDGVYASKGKNAYPQLFESPIQHDIEDLKDVSGVTPNFWTGRLDLQPDCLIENFEGGNHTNSRVYRKYSIRLEDLDQPEPLAVFWSYLPKMARLSRLLRRDPRFAGQTHDMILSKYLERYFQPNARVRTEVVAFLATLPRPVIGVHVRYTDRKMPLEPIKQTIARQMAKNPDSSLFLATDSAYVEEYMARSFGPIHVTPKYLSQDNDRLHMTQDVPFDKQFEAENALIDMWVLAGCDHLIYSKNSTFSLTSALIGKLDRARQTDVDRANPKILAKRLIQPLL